MTIKIKKLGYPSRYPSALGLSIIQPSATVVTTGGNHNVETSPDINHTGWPTRMIYCFIYSTLSLHGTVLHNDVALSRLSGLFRHKLFFSLNWQGRRKLHPHRIASKATIIDCYTTPQQKWSVWQESNLQSPKAFVLQTNVANQ